VHSPESRRQRRAAALCLLVLGPGAAPADELVAPYVPTVEEDVELMLDVGRVGPDDYVVDLGAGDGRIVIAAARRGALGHGVELDPELVALARANAQTAGVADRVAFVEGDIFETDIARATVVMLYLFPEANLELRPKLLAELRPGTRVVSNSFHMGKWQPDAHDLSARSSGGILLWIVPARIEGDWRLDIESGEHYAFTAEQAFQEIALGLAGSGPALAFEAATLSGDRIRFRAESAEARYVFDGRIDAGGMAGYVQIDRAGGREIARWQATRL